MRVEQRPRILSLIAQCLWWPNHPEKGNNNNGTRAYLYECFQRQDLVEHLLQHDENENWGLTNLERRHQTPRLDRDPSLIPVDVTYTPPVWYNSQVVANTQRAALDYASCRTALQLQRCQGRE